ncbi:MAG: SUMF1/EgtB/PvdO family nonheme iron enzyme, partial [Bacteroidota bacterium]
NLYASEREVNNSDYWLFMEYLRTNGYIDLYEKFFQDLSSYDPVTKSLMSNYHYTPVNFKELDAKSKKKNMLKYPAMDFTYEAALAFCKWMTDQYNGNEKRAFKKVLFRLPSQEEWTMAALGYRGFQSWKLEENTITVKSKEGKAPELQVRLSEHTISYPWGIKAWDFRNRINNKHNCYLANVKIGEKITCAAGIKGDGFSFTSPGTTYFANEMGLYDVVGNVAEMISDPGVAMGGSWDDTPEKSTITSSYRYEGSDIKVGMRLFMEVIEE